MTQISDFAAKENANLASIRAGILALDSKIQAFQNSPGTLSIPDQAMLEQIVVSSAALATLANTPVVPPVVTPSARRPNATRRKYYPK